MNPIAETKQKEHSRLWEELGRGTAEPEMHVCRCVYILQRGQSERQVVGDSICLSSPGPGSCEEVKQRPAVHQGGRRDCHVFQQFSLPSGREFPCSQRNPADLRSWPFLHSPHLRETVLEKFLAERCAIRLAAQSSECPMLPWVFLFLPWRKREFE